MYRSMGKVLMDNSKRDVSIDICKGIGIMLMVLGHSGSPKIVHDFIYMFHMPLFFFVSGYCFDEKYLNIPFAFVKKKIKGLWWPYVKYSILFLLLHNLFCYLNIYSSKYGYQGHGVSMLNIRQIKDSLWTIVTGMTGHDQLLGGFWFLRELLLGSVIALVTMQAIKSMSLRYRFVRFSILGGVIFLLLTSVLMNKYVLVFPCFNVCSLTVLAAAIFLAGHVYKEHKCCTNLLWTVTFVIIVCLGSVLMPMEILTLEWFNIVPYFAFGVMGTIMTINISRILSTCSMLGCFFSWVGRETLTVLTWHLLAFKIVSLFIIKQNGMSVEHLGEFPVMSGFAEQGWWIAYFVVAMVVTLSIAKVKSSFKHLL